MSRLGRKLIFCFLVVFSLACCLLGGNNHHVNAASFYRMDARAAYAIDADTGQVLYQKNAQRTYPIASLTKILTLAVIEQDIHAHKLSWNQKITISPAVAKVANDWHFSNVQLNVSEKYSVRQLVDSMMLVSADGSTEALALADAGSTAAFNHKMQVIAHKAGVTDAKIYNMIGLPNKSLGKQKLRGVNKDAENKMSARDLALISRYLIKHYPETLQITKKKFANFNISAGQQCQLVNINALLPKNGYAPKDWAIDGLKTGNTDAAGKCIVTTGTYMGHRVILVGLHTKGDWNNQSKMQKAFYEQLATAYQPVELKNIHQLPRSAQQTRIVHAKKYRHSVPLTLKKSTWLWVPRNSTWQQTRPTVIINHRRQSFSGKLQAPVKKGETVGYLKLYLHGLPEVQLPIQAAKTVTQRGF
ncbi:D-alanyl-D-alanine carboxypeptidase family protein [Limosilactobacillus sp.]|jgi:D-alanyl-D-alanine carboxypeptidase (penicillin-binding protein 5/6)|uniref:D-alanyl-D-alanine carboxypeptidase family protein n=1 Tax=Limosilactobacillus sp. TaxID=2773925 RepID=UPI00359FBC7D